MNNVKHQGVARTVKHWSARFGIDVLLAGAWGAVGASITLTFAAIYFVGGSSHSTWDEVPAMVLHGLESVLRYSPWLLVPILTWIRVARGVRSVRIVPAVRRMSVILLGICFYVSWPINAYLHEAADGVDPETLNECVLNFFDPRLLTYSFPFLLCTLLFVNLPNLFFRRWLDAAFTARSARAANDNAAS